MKRGQVECKQNSMGHMPVAKHRHKDTDSVSAPTAGLCPNGFKCRCVRCVFVPGWPCACTCTHVKNLVRRRLTVVFCLILTHLRGFPKATFKEMNRIKVDIYSLYLLRLFL